MDNIHELPDREQIESEAAEWLIRMDGDTRLSHHELERLRDWMAQSNSHRDTLLELSEFWGDQSLVALPIPLSQLSETHSTSTHEPQANTPSAPHRLWQHWLTSTRGFASAAALLLAVWIMAGSPLLPMGQGNAEQARYATAIGQRRSIDLPDGSVVHLNTNSQIKVDYSKAERKVQLLQGEAHFDVAKQPERPFQVYAGQGRVQAVGTAFTVYYRDNNDVDVLVNEGVVSLAVLSDTGPSDQTPAPASGADGEAQAANAEPASVQNPKPHSASALPSTEYYLAIPMDELGLLKAGQETTILMAQETERGEGSRLDHVRSIAEEEMQRRGAWRKGLLVFTGNSLEEVVAEISRYTTLSIEIVDPELKQVRIGGRFSLDDTNALFAALEANFSLKITQVDYKHVKISSVEKKKENEILKK